MSRHPHDEAEQRRARLNPWGAEGLLAEYERSTSSKLELIEQARQTEKQLNSIAESLGDLFADPPFRALLRDQGIQEISENLARRIAQSRWK